MEHPSGIPEKIVRKVVARRGRLHAFETLDPRRTALVVIDLDQATVAADDTCRRIVPIVNAVAEAVRAGGGAGSGAGGKVAWVLSHMPAVTPNFVAILGPALAAQYVDEMQPSGPRRVLWPACDRRAGDLDAIKSGASAFFPGKCDLHEQLQRRGIDTLLIAGTVTNICCESSARDATELGYRVVLVSDALAGHAHGLHEATLATFYRIFGDVRPSREVIELLSI